MRKIKQKEVFKSPADIEENINILNPQHIIDYSLSSACFHGDFDEVKELIKQGADINARNGDAITVATCKGYIEIMKFLIEQGADINSKNMALIYATSPLNGRCETVKYLIEKGADVNARNGHALISAVIYGHIDVVKLLIENGANVDFAFKHDYISIKNELISTIEKALLKSDLHSIKPKAQAPRRRI